MTNVTVPLPFLHLIGCRNQKKGPSGHPLGTFNEVMQLNNKAHFLPLGSTNDVFAVEPGVAGHEDTPAERRYQVAMPRMVPMVVAGEHPSESVLTALQPGPQSRGVDIQALLSRDCFPHRGCSTHRGGKSRGAKRLQH